MISKFVLGHIAILSRPVYGHRCLLTYLGNLFPWYSIDFGIYFFHFLVKFTKYFISFCVIISYCSLISFRIVLCKSMKIQWFLIIDFKKIF